MIIPNIFKAKSVLKLLDSLFALFIVGPAVIGYWRGTWNLVEYYISTANHLEDCLISLAIGFAGTLILCLGQGPIKRLLEGKSRASFILISWCYTSIRGFLDVNVWRGIWYIADLYKELSVECIFGATILALFILGGLKVLTNSLASPCVTTVCDSGNYFDIPTYFKNTSHQKTSWYILDSIFSMVVIGSLVPFVWVGSWTLIELIIFPDNLLLSVLSTLVFGYGVLLITFGLEPAVCTACIHLEGVQKYLLADLFSLVCFLGTVSLWRSIWMLLEIYFLPEYPILSSWITQIGSLILLLSLNCGNSILGSGVYKDVEKTDTGEIIMLPVEYLQILLQIEKKNFSMENPNTDAAKLPTYVQKF